MLWIVSLQEKSGGRAAITFLAEKHFLRILQV
jgi:hypothetical protein